MNWIDIGEGIEIMERPMLNYEIGYGYTNLHPNSPVRGITQQKAHEWADTFGWRLPTEEEWLRGWPFMQHWGLLEWTATIEDGYAVVRGGSWYSDYPENLRVANRYRNIPVSRFITVGFRCVREKQ